MRSSFIAFLWVVLVAGCVKEPTILPADFEGPKATISDTVRAAEFDKYGRARNAYFFVAKRIEGQTLRDSRTRTLTALRGDGDGIVPAAQTHDVPAERITVEVMALDMQSPSGPSIFGGKAKPIAVNATRTVRHDTGVKVHY